MANEITFNVSLSIVKVDATTGIQIVYENDSGQNKVSMLGNSGPYIGTVSVPTTGMAVDLSGVEGGIPGACWLKNEDPANPVSVGTKDTMTGKFSPLLRLLPGMKYPVYLDPHIGVEESGAGSSTTGTDVLFLKAFNGTCKVTLKVYPK
jgi:hypothetical protein